MKQGPRRTDKRPAPATRRQFLSTIVVGAAYTACGDVGTPDGMSTRPPDPAPGPTRPPTMPPTGPTEMPPGQTPTQPPPGQQPPTGQTPTQPQPGQPPAQPPPGQPPAQPPPQPPTGPMVKRASDRVILGSTGIEVSRLAMGSGTNGSGGTSQQTRLGVPGFSRLLVQSYHEQGLNFFETADGYGAHPHVGEAIRQLGRDKVVVMTKTKARTAAEMRADLDRFRRELGVEMIDIVLLHAVESGTWTQQLAGAMDVLSEAKMKGEIRAHGISCHSLPALRLAARTPWVDVDLARINAARIQMDSDPATVISVLREMKTAGKGVIGMKILGVGRLANQMEAAISHAVKLDSIDCFTIGFTSYTQLTQVTDRIAAVPA